MAPPRQLDKFSHREFDVVVAQDGDRVRAIARDVKRQQVAEVSGTTAHEVTADIKIRLNNLSSEFVSVEGASNLFLKVFSEGFESSFYYHYERKYKERTASFLIDRLSHTHLNDLIHAGHHQEVCSLARQALSTSNLTFANEQIALSDALKHRGTVVPFAEGFRDLMYGDFDTSLEKLARLLRPHNAAKWPIITFWPFFRFPDRHMFLKPTIVQECAERMGYDFHYDSMPNRRTYDSLLRFTSFLREGIAELQPKDNIDVQTFMYVVGKEGYARHAIEDRERL